MLRRYRGVLAIAVTIAAVVGWVLVTDPIESAEVAPTTSRVVADDLASMALPADVVPWDRAEAEGTIDEIEWGARCDTATGDLALPYIKAGPCFAPFEGDNGGATSPGVTADTVRVVVYQASLTDPMGAMVAQIAGAAGDPDAAFRAREGFVELFSHYFETYGRRVELISFQGTGGASDPVAAVADAETIARDLEPFLVFGGTLLTNAFADTLAARGVMCWVCSPGQPDAFYDDHAPYVWDLLKNPEQNGLMVNEYIGKRLAGRPAKWAGDPAMHDKERVFGSLSIELGPDSAAIGKILEKDLERYGVEVAVKATFTDPSAVNTTARELITKLKEGGVTTVVYTGDPLAPGTLTQVATEQGYFPEWVITGTALIDTNLLTRTYDQRQWAHAFGPANLFVRSTRPAALGELWRWYFGTEPPVQGPSLSATIGPLQVLFIALQLMGPDVSPEAFERTLFAAPTIVGSPTLGQISFGTRLWEDPDYTALDDQAEVWWDPEATGLDELDHQGTGMWRWVDGGKRVLPGDWPETEPDVFDPSTAVITLEEPPLPPTTYQPLR